MESPPELFYRPTADLWANPYPNPTDFIVSAGLFRSVNADAHEDNPGDGTLAIGPEADAPLPCHQLPVSSKSAIGSFDNPHSRSSPTKRFQLAVGFRTDACELVLLTLPAAARPPRPPNLRAR
ncbi:MAG: hypothetical protein R3B90_01000 [Planctomycetaceae bacterium]